jgi:hypothetical protein
MSQYTASIQALYVAYFNRPADPSGLAFWEPIVAAANGNTAGVSADFAKQPEYKAAYAGLSNDAIINQIYLNIFGRTADLGGLDYWSGKLTAHLITIDQIVTEVAKGAQGLDKTTYVNRTTASVAYTEALNADAALRLAYSNAAAIASAKAFLNGITTDASLVAAIEPAALNANQQQMVLDSAPIGLTYALTPNPDTIVGTVNSDTFTASVGGAPGTLGTPGTPGTLTPFDNIDGGAGRDALTITDTIDGNAIATGAFAGVTLKSIETINFQTLGAVAFDSTGFTSVNALNIKSAGIDAVTAAAVTSVDITNSLATGAIVGTAVTVNGGSNINVNNTLGAVSVGATTKATGNVTVKTTGAGNAVTIVGGKNIVTNSADAVTISKVSGTVAVTTTTTSAAITVNGGTDVSVVSKANSGAINVGTNAISYAVDATTGKQTISNIADYATGKVTINNSTTAGTVTTYGTGVVNAYTLGGTSVSVTGGGITDIADINSVPLIPSTGAAAVVGTSKLATVVLTGVSGATTIQSDALVNLAMTKVSAGVTAIVTGAHALTIASVANASTVTDATATGIAVVTSGTVADMLTLNATKATAVTVGGSGTKFTLGSLAAVGTTAGPASAPAAAISLTVTGAVVANLGDLSLNAKLTGVDASANTGGVTVTNMGTTASFTGGTGADTVSLGATTKAIALGDGNDTVILTGGVLAATGSIDGGAGFDTLVGSSVNMQAQLGDASTAKIVGFDMIKVSDALAAGASFDMSALAGTVAFAAGNGVAAGGTATINNLGAGASVQVLGSAANNGILALVMKTDTAADVLNVTVSHDFTDTNAGFVNAFATNLSAAKVETLNITSTANPSAAAADAPDSVNNSLSIADAALVTLNLSGNQAVTFASTALQTKLAMIDASADTAGATINALASTAGLTIKGSATAANTLTGSGFVDTIIGGAKADVITGGLGGDTLTGNGGNDTFVIANSDSIITAGKADTITDFVANTYGGAGTTSVATSAATSGNAAKWTGDVIQLTHGMNVGTGVAVSSAITVGVYTNASDATTFLATQSGTEGAAAQTVHAALNSTTGDLYVDINGDGVADLYLHLTGVNTLTAAAFVVM